uniref:MLLT3 super elongation complex subunit n=1 Tax=Neolamprologus brichardi TaxID=32507 RepID=A0A3Q4MLP0_NEOBR
MVFVRGPEHSNIQHFVEKVVFHLHESFPKPKRVCKDPPYKVEESGYAGFILPIEVYFRNKEEPKKVRFDYDLFLHLEGHPPVNHLRCEKLTFNNPTEEFRRKLLKAGGQRNPHKRSSEDSKVMIMQEGSASLFGSHLKLATLPNSSDTKKSKGFNASKDGSTGNAFLIMATTTSTDNSSISKLHKPFKDHKDKTPKDLKDPKSAFRDSGWEPGKAPKESSRKPKENQPLREINPKMGFKQPKSLSKERRTEGITHASRLNKRLSGLDGDDHGTKRRKKGFVNSSEMPISELDGQSLDKKLLRDRSQLHTSKLRAESEDADLRSASTLPPFQDLVDANDSDVEDQSARSDVSKRDALLSLQLGMSSSTGFIELFHSVLGPLQSVMQDLHSDDDDDDDSDDDDVDSDTDRAGHARLTHHQHRLVTRGQLFERLNSTLVYVFMSLLCAFQVYLDELVELHKRLMTLREGHILQQIVNLIEETGHFHITNTTFDFDLCSLDRSTVRKLQSYLGTS